MADAGSELEAAKAASEAQKRRESGYFDSSTHALDDFEVLIGQHLRGDRYGKIFAEWGSHELAAKDFDKEVGAANSDNNVRTYALWGEGPERDLLRRLRGINYQKLGEFANQVAELAGDHRNANDADGIQLMQKQADPSRFPGALGDAVRAKLEPVAGAQLTEPIMRYSEGARRASDAIRHYVEVARGEIKRLTDWARGCNFKKLYIDSGFNYDDWVQDIQGIEFLRTQYRNSEEGLSGQGFFGKFVWDHFQRDPALQELRKSGRRPEDIYSEEVGLGLKHLERPGKIARTEYGIESAENIPLWTPLRLDGSPGCRDASMVGSWFKYDGRAGAPAHERIFHLDAFCARYDWTVRYLRDLVKDIVEIINLTLGWVLEVLRNPERDIAPPQIAQHLREVRELSYNDPANTKGNPGMQPLGGTPPGAAVPPEAPPDFDKKDGPDDVDPDDDNDGVPDVEDSEPFNDKVTGKEKGGGGGQEEGGGGQNQNPPNNGLTPEQIQQMQQQQQQQMQNPGGTTSQGIGTLPGAPNVTQPQVPQPSTSIPAGQPGAINNPNLPGAVIPPQPLVPGQAPPAPKPLAPIEQRMGHEIKPIGNRADIRVADPDQQGTRSPERNHPLGDRQVVSLERKPVEGGKPGEFAHNEFILTVDKDGEGAEAPQKFLVSFPHDAPPPVDPNAAAQQPGQPQPEPGNEGQPAEGQPQVGPDGKPVAPAPQLGPDGKPVPLAPEQAWEGLRQATITPWDDQNQDNKVGQEELGQPVEKGKPLLVDLGNGYKEEISVNWDPEMGVNAAEPGPNGEPGDPNNPRIDQLNLQVKPVEGDGALPVDPNLMKTQGYTINFEGSPNQSGEMQSLTPEQGKQLAADSPSGVDSQALPGSQSSSALSTPGGQNWGASGNGATNSTYEPVGAGSGTGASTGTQPPNGPQLPGGGQASGGNQTTPPGPQPAAAQTSSAAASTSPQSAGGGGMMPPMAPPMGGMGGPQAAGQGGQSKYPIQGQIFDEEERHRYLHNPVLGDERERRSGSDRSTTRRDQRYGEDPDRPRNSELQRWDEPPRRW